MNVEIVSSKKNPSSWNIPSVFKYYYVVPYINDHISRTFIKHKM